VRAAVQRGRRGEHGGELRRVRRGSDDDPRRAVEEDDADPLAGGTVRHELPRGRHRGDDRCPAHALARVDHEHRPEVPCPGGSAGRHLEVLDVPVVLAHADVRRREHLLPRQGEDEAALRES
jgi:hypothetical protein